MKSNIFTQVWIANDPFMKLPVTIYFLLFGMHLFNACAPQPYKATNKVYKQKVKGLAKVIKTEPGNDFDGLHKDRPAFIGTTNFGLRKPNFVILHHTAQNSCGQTLKTFTTDSTQVSAHYVICKDGILHHMLNDYLRAWHAGAAKWGNTTDINSSSIGIEIDNNGIDSFTEAQLHTLELLLATLKKSYNIPAANFIGHADIAPGRKVDPSIYFPWKRFADSGHGLWYADTTNVTVPPGFDAKMALRIIGYDISRPAAAYQAFRLHFLQSAASGELLEPEKKVLYMLMKEQL